MKKLFFAAIAALFLANISFAAGSSVMLVTDLTSVDSSIASAAAAKAGIPVLVLENGTLNGNIRSELQQQSIQNVILVGGPAVIKPQVETELRASGYSVVRLWGYERTGTAIAVARYFWPEGTNCTVLVDDTKDSGKDSDLQMSASNLASQHNCTFIPVPEGTVPADVLSLLKDLNVSEVRFVYSVPHPGISAYLGEFRLRELSENETDNETESAHKLVIVATPDWKAATAVSANPNSDSAVIRVYNLSQVPRIIDLINSKNITDVRVVGLPALADQIASQLAAANITVTKISGPKASDISRELYERIKLEWDKKRAENESEKIRLSVRIKASLEADINTTLAKLDAAIARLDAINTTDSESVKAAVDAAKARFTEVRNMIASGNLDGAKMLLYQLKFVADEKEFELRDKLNVRINDSISDEEQNVNDAQSGTNNMLESARQAITNARPRCANTSAIDALVQKAVDLKSEIQSEKAAGNFTGMSSHLDEIKDLVQTVKGIAVTCSRSGSLPPVAAGVLIREGIASHESSGKNAQNQSGK